MNECGVCRLPLYIEKTVEIKLCRHLFHLKCLHIDNTSRYAFCICPTCHVRFLCLYGLVHIDIHAFPMPYGYYLNTDFLLVIP